MKVLCRKIKDNENAFSLVEAILAVSIFAFIVTALVGSYLYGLEGTADAGSRARAVMLAEEGIEAVRSIKQQAFNELVLSQSGIDDASNQWKFLGEGTSETIDIFTRTITFANVCRDVADIITACPGVYTDLFTKEVIVEVSWEAAPAFTRSVVRRDFLTAWETKLWSQTNWIGGAGQAIWSDTTRYDSDDSNVNVTAAGEVGLKLNVSGACGNTWDFSSSGDYTFDTGKIEVTGGFAQLKAGGAGLIGDAVIDTLEFDSSDGYRPSVVHVSGDVYAVSYTGPSTDGFVRTFTVDSAGQIENAYIDSLEFDTNTGLNTDIIHISGTTYAVAYTGSGNDGFVRTLDIQANGQIGNFYIDSLEFDTSNGLEPDIEHVASNIYAVAYRGVNDDGFVRTMQIDANGQIGNSYIDSLEFDTQNCNRPDLLLVSGTAFVVAYTGDGSDGFIRTFDIQANGQIDNAYDDSLEFDTSDAYTPSLANISGTTYAIAYSGSGNDGFLVTFDMQTNGQIGNSILDSYEFNTQYAYDTFITLVTTEVVAIVYQDQNIDGTVQTIQVSSDGTITESVIDTLVYDSGQGLEGKLISVSSTIYLIVYRGSGNDGWAATIGIGALAYPVDKPTIQPVAAYNPGASIIISDFIETANKNGGEIYYQISDDGGTIWYYWDGSQWSAAGPTNYNTASIVDTYISSFDGINGSIMFRAFLESDGSQLVQLDELVVDCEIGGEMRDDTQAEFNQGTYVDTAFDTDHVELTPTGQANGSGTFTSRIYNAGAGVIWQVLGWEPSAPYGKTLPDSNATETAYSTGNISMSADETLFHLDELLGASTFIESSSNGYNASCSGSICPTAGGSSILNTALSFDGVNDYIAVSSDLNQWAGATATFSYWIKTTQIGDSVFWDAPGITGVESNGDGDDIFWGWIDNNGRIGLQVGDSGSIKSTNPINDNQWHHIAMSRNHLTGEVKLYVDGQLNTQTTLESGAKTTPFHSIGRIEDTGGTPEYYQGMLDEFSSWNSVLADTDISNIYKRGSLDIRFQIRSCDDALCNGEVFVGPDGTGATYYSELGNSSVNLPSLGITGVAGNQYFQYKAYFMTSNSSFTPELREVRATFDQVTGYAMNGSIVSSAYNMGGSASVQLINWDQSIPICSPACSIKLQIRTAPDNAGSPGSWTSWYGATGSGTYFTSASGTIVPFALNGNRWVQYRVELSGDGNATPVLQEVRVYYK